jgi:hypothetical protein
MVDENFSRADHTVVLISSLVTFFFFICLTGVIIKMIACRKDQERDAYTLVTFILLALTLLCNRTDYHL